jgi:hypothetical protein
MPKYEMIIYWSEQDKAYIVEVPEARKAGFKNGPIDDAYYLTCRMRYCIFYTVDYLR